MFKGLFGTIVKDFFSKEKKDIDLTDFDFEDSKADMSGTYILAAFAFIALIGGGLLVAKTLK